MARKNLQDKNYQSMSDKYKQKFSRDEFKAQKRAQAKRRALQAGDKEAAAKAGVTHKGKLGEKSQFFQTNEKGKRKLTNMEESASPFKVDNIQDFDTAAYGAGSERGKETLNRKDIKGLKTQGGFTSAEVQDYAQGLKDSGVKIGKGAQKKLEKMQAQALERANKFSEKKQQPSAPQPAVIEKPVATQQPVVTEKPPVIQKPVVTQQPAVTQKVKDSGNVRGDNSQGGIGNVNTDSSFKAEDINANIGKQGDMTTKIKNSSFGAGASVGNDYTVTVGNMKIGNDGQVSGGGGDGYGGGLSNMQAATAYNALNNNALARSKSQLSGYGRAAGAIEEAKKANSTPNADQQAAYNFAGANQNYLKDRIAQIRSGYMGNLDGYQAPEFMMPIAPKAVDLDPGKDIYEDMMKNFT